MRKLSRGALALAGATVAVIVVTLLVVVFRWLADRPLRTLAVGGAVVFGALLVGRLAAGVARARSRWILEWELDGLPPEAGPSSPLDLLGGARRSTVTMRDMVEVLDRAAADRRVRGIFLNVGGTEGTMAAAQEVHDALIRFRGSGKPVVAFADSFEGNLSCLVASAADEIVLQPGGGMALVGFARDVNFLKKALGKAGVGFEVGKRHEYKSAFDQLVEEGFSEPHRESLARLYEALHGQLVAGIAHGRGMSADAVEGALQRGPLEDAEAVEAGLVDRLAYRDEAIEQVKERAGGGSLLYLDRYKKRARKQIGGKTVAVVAATGPIVPRRSGAPPLMPGGTPMDAGAVAAVLRKAAADKKVKAIVLRVHSPGGSAVASETIWREVVRARAGGTPVVVSMAGVAASGGYFIAAPADRIVAQPGTITGSIGVVTGKPVLGELKERAGIVVEDLSTGRHAGMYSANRRWDPAERARIDRGLDAVYANFTGKVAEGRNLEPDRVHELARGRVWVGEDAHRHGLVDVLGGLSAAVDAARELAGLAPDAKVRMRPYPKAASPLAQISKRRGESSEDRKAARALLEAAAAAVTMAGPVVEAAASLGLLGDPGEVHAGFGTTDWTFR